MSRRVSVLPLHGFRGFVVVADVAHELALQVGDGSEDTSGDNVALDLAEPQLDLVQPRGVSRGEVLTRSGDDKSRLNSRVLPSGCCNRCARFTTRQLTRCSFRADAVTAGCVCERLV